MAESVVSSRSAIVEERMTNRKGKRKRPSQIVKERRLAQGEDLERTSQQELIMDVLGTVHEGVSQSDSNIMKPLKGAVSGALVGARIGEAVKKYKARKRARKLGEDSV